MKAGAKVEVIEIEAGHEQTTDDLESGFKLATEPGQTRAS
jgi:hypothetical protein